MWLLKLERFFWSAVSIFLMLLLFAGIIYTGVEIVRHINYVLMVTWYLVRLMVWMIIWLFMTFFIVFKGTFAVEKLQKRILLWKPFYCVLYGTTFLGGIFFAGGISVLIGRLFQIGTY
jgi:hypothetical protein